MSRQYCPKCKCWVGGENVEGNFHSCGCRVVPAYSQAMRLQAENERLREHINAALEDLPHKPDSAKDYLIHTLKETSNGKAEE